VRTIAVVGSSAAVIEMLLAMEHRLARAAGENVPRFALITEAPHVLHEHTPAMRKRIGKILIARDIVLYAGSAVAAVEPGAVVTSTGRRIAADRVIWATPAAGAPWLASSSLACDAHGFVRVSASLQSVSDPFVFAVGDCATRDGAPHLKGRAFAARDGAPLAANLRRAARHEPLVDVRPRQRSMSVITTGPRHAVAAWGPVISDGERIWRWKERVDRAYLARYHPPVANSEAAVPPQ
jgi:selenide,water dikinase